MFEPVLLSGTPILDVDATLLIYLAAFGLLFFTLRALVFRPVMSLLDERDKATTGAREEAKRLELEADEKMVAFEQQLAKVRLEATAERDRLRAEGTRLDRSLNEKVRRETDDLVREAETQMAQDAAKIRRGIETSSPELAKEIAAKLLGRKVGS